MKKKSNIKRNLVVRQDFFFLYFSLCIEVFFWMTTELAYEIIRELFAYIDVSADRAAPDGFTAFGLSNWFWSWLYILLVVIIGAGTVQTNSP